VRNLIQRVTSSTMRHFIEADTTSIEVVLALESILLGVWLLLPFDTFGSSATFNSLRMWPGEVATGLFVLATGLARTFGLATRSIRTRQIAAIYGLFVWSYIDYSFAESNIVATGVVTYFLFVVLSIWILSSLSWKIYSGRTR